MDVESRTVEVELGPRDILVLSAPKAISAEVAARLKAELEVLIARDGRTAVVIEAGWGLNVIRRDTPEAT